MSPDVLILGAGLSGLAAALHLERAGLSCLILEKSDDVGGRIRTDELDGFRLDRGFQIWITSYPEGKALLDYPALKLGTFVPGALCWDGARFHRLSDPRRDPKHAWASAFSGAATFIDKLRSARTLLPLLKGNPEDMLPPDVVEPREPPRAAVPDARTGRVLVGTSVRPPAAATTDSRRLTTIEYLRSRGFSEQSIRRFWRPFLSGVLLERDLATAAGFTQYTLRMFATGEAALPAGGMGAIPKQLASKLVRSRIEFGAEAVLVGSGSVTLADGRRLTARAVLVATEDSAARALLALPPGPPPEQKATLNLYFAADRAPLAEPILLLDGEGTGPINTVAIPSLVAPGYAPPGQHLMSLSTVGLPRMTDDEVRTAARAQIRTWFGPQVDTWRHLRTYRITHALPDASPQARPEWRPTPRIAQGLYRAGDALDSPSSQGALASARRAADAILTDLR